MRIAPIPRHGPIRIGSSDISNCGGADRLSRPPSGALYLGALLLAYYDPDGRLVCAGRVGTDLTTAERERLWRRLCWRNSPTAVWAP